MQNTCPVYDAGEIKNKNKKTEKGDVHMSDTASREEKQVTNIDILDTKRLKQSQYGAYKPFSKLILRICKDFKGICIRMSRFACPMFRRKRIVRCMYHLYIPYINVVYHTKHIPILGSIRNNL